MLHDPLELKNLERKGQSMVTTEEILKLGKEIKAVECMGCSALKAEGLREIFNEAIITVINKRHKDEIKKKNDKHKCVFV